MRRFILGASLFIIVGMGYPGVDGQNIRCVYAPQDDRSVLAVGTDYSLYVCHKGRDEGCKRVKGFPPERCGTRRFIARDGDEKGVYVATEKGVFYLNMGKYEARPVYRSTTSLEKDCYAFLVLESGSMFVGTGAGLFVNDGASSVWSKIASPFGDQQIVAMHKAGDRIYAVTPNTVYCSDDLGKTWQEIYRAVVRSQEIEASSEPMDESSVAAPVFVDLAGASQSHGRLFLGASNGIYESLDGGKNWQMLPLAKFDYKNVRRLKYHEQQGILYVLTENALYGLEEGVWSKRRGFRDGQDFFLQNDSILIATEEEILEYVFDRSVESLDDEERVVPDSLLACFDDEPSIREVQEMAIAYSETSDQKIKGWRRRASLKAILPKVSVSTDRSVYGSSSGAFAVGPQDFGVTASWELGDLVFNADQTAIDTRSKLMAEMRNDILSEVTRLYFERRKAQIELLRSSELPTKEELDKKLRLHELTALIDRLTGGYFSRSLKI